MTDATHDTPEFRLASPGDWPGIWRVFRSVVRTGESYMFAPDTTEPEARAAWTPDPPGRQETFVARLGGEIAATAILKPNQPALGDHVANAAWMVHPDHAGKGLGRRFAEHVIDHAAASGYRAMQFNAVVSTNAPAIALWESLGFATVGEIPEAFRRPDGSLTSVYVMHRRLT